MTPAEREELRKKSEKAKLVMKNGYATPHNNHVVQAFTEAAKPAKVIALLDLVSSLELTLSNATKVGVLQMERIAALESALRNYRGLHKVEELCSMDHQDGDNRCSMCNEADALLAAPTEPTAKERK